jgi:hypothetical protein
MPNKVLTAALLAFALAAVCALPAHAQGVAKQPPPATQGTPYKAVPITLPGDSADTALTALRNQLGEAAKKRDAAAVAKLVASSGFFWDRGRANAAGKPRSGFETLSAALGLASKDSVGWDMLAGYADDPSVAPSPARKGAVCAPAEPSYDVAALTQLLKATQSNTADWAYPVSNGIEVRTAPGNSTPAIDKLGLHLVRIMPEAKATSAAFHRVLTPAGKIGFVSIDALALFGNDQICYVKDAGGAWKIGGYIGGGEPQ